MNIQDKFATILKLNKLGINSIFALEKYSKVGVGSVSKFLNNNESPSMGTIKKIQDALGINTGWWDTGKGEVFIEKHTLVQEGSDNKEITKEEVYRELIEANSNYSIIPRTVLDGEYRIVAKSELDLKDQELKQRIQEYQDRKNERQDTIDALKLVIKTYEEEIARLRAGKAVAPQKTH